MREETKWNWEVGLGVATPVLTIVGILVGVSQFNAGERNRQKLEIDAAEHRDKLEFRRRLWTEKLEMYRKIVELAARIGSDSSTPREREAAIKDFSAAYLGGMVLVEDESVKLEMIEFASLIQNYEREPSAERLGALGTRAIILADACRKALSDGKP